MPDAKPSEKPSSKPAHPTDCTCIIHRVFYGKLQSDVTCEVCKNVTTAEDPVMDLSLDLRLKNKKGQLGQGAIIQSLQQCLARFTATEKLDREYNCGKCEAPREATKQLTVKRLPPVLCIQLKVCGLKMAGLKTSSARPCLRREYCKFNNPIANTS